MMAPNPSCNTAVNRTGETGRSHSLAAPKARSLHIHINTGGQRRREGQNLQGFVLLPEGASGGCAGGHETLSPLAASAALKSGTLIHTSTKSCSSRRAGKGIRLRFNSIRFKMKSPNSISLLMAKGVIRLARGRPVVDAATGASRGPNCWLGTQREVAAHPGASVPPSYRKSRN